MSQASNRFRIKNITWTFLTVHLISGPVDVRPNQIVGPFPIEEKSDQLEWLRKCGALAIIDEYAEPEKSPAPDEKSNSELKEK